MTPFLTDLSPAGLTHANEENLTAWLPLFGSLGQYLVDDPPGVKRSITDNKMPLFNSIMDSRLEPGQVEAAIERVTSDARARQVSVDWWIFPSSRPADLAARLLEHGFVISEEGPGMASDLAGLDANRKPPEGLTVTVAQDDAGRRDWTRALMAGFEAPPTANEVTNGWQAVIRNTNPGILKAYIGWWDNRPLAASLLFLGGGVAGIYAVVTAPEARRKGIGTWMTHLPLLQAREMGYRVGVLQASEMGAPIYRTLNFKEYCRISSYVWRPA